MRPACEVGIDRKILRARTGNEPDNDHTNTPTATQSGRLFHLSFERDAVVAAICAREGFEGRWPTDLAEQRGSLEQNPKAYWLAPMSYFWTECV